MSLLANLVPLALEKSVQGLIDRSTVDHIVISQQALLLESQFLQHAARYMVVLMNVRNQLPQFRFGKDFVHKEPDCGSGNSFSMMRHGDAISYFAVAHGVADIFQ